MDQYICNYRTIRDISTTDSSFLPSVYNFYKNDIIMPKKTQDDIILLLGKEYGLKKVLYSELSSINDYVPKKLIYKPHKRGFYHALFMSSSILCGCECTNL